MWHIFCTALRPRNGVIFHNFKVKSVQADTCEDCENTSMFCCLVRRPLDIACPARPTRGHQNPPPPTPQRDRHPVTREHTGGTTVSGVRTEHFGLELASCSLAIGHVTGFTANKPGPCTPGPLTPGPRTPGPRTPGPTTKYPHSISHHSWLT